MTNDEKVKLIEILTTKEKPWEARAKALEYVRHAPVQENAPTGSFDANKGIRTSNQNSAIHLWFRQIADICQKQGVTMNLIIMHTHDVQVTEYGVKALWHVLQKALYGTESTTQLKKSGQIDTMIDHFVSLFAKEEVELPPFPNEPDKNNIKLAQMDNLSNKNYPIYEGEATF